MNVVMDTPDNQTRELIATSYTIFGHCIEFVCISCHVYLFILFFFQSLAAAVSVAIFICSLIMYSYPWHGVADHGSVLCHQ